MQTNEQIRNFNAAVQAGIARDFAIAKAARKPKKVHQEEGHIPYSKRMGKLGASSVSNAIAAENQSQIPSRRERRQKAKELKVPFKPLRGF